MKKKVSKTEKKENKENKYEEGGALFIPGGVLLGLGVGFLMGNIPAGLFIGLGAGFFCFAIAMILGRK